jgi:prepilin-type N-terminal cleavage/methylation domain-containing protein
MKPRSSAGRAFTLVEMMVALAVLSLLILIIIQVLSFSAQAVDKNSKNLDASSQARLVFDRIGVDFAARAKRTDLGVVFTKTTTAGVSDCFRFYSQVAGYSGTRGVTAVGYWVPSSDAGSQHPIYQLERGAVGTDWTGGTGMSFLPSVLTEADTTAADNPLTDYDVLASDVFRLEFCYLKTDGTLTINNPNAGTANPTSLTGIAGVVVALAVIDDKSMQLLSSPSTQLGALSEALEKTPDGADPIAGWNAAINAGLGVSGIPNPVLQNLRVYERTFYVQ